jgi:hypothetical protein
LCVFSCVSLPTHHLTQKMLDAEWIEAKAKVIADLNAAKAEIEAKL